MSDIQKIDHLTKRCSDLLSEMKRHERESIKNKKRGDQLQKDKDNTRNELNKTTSLKEKLEKLCRELQKENNKLKNENKTLSDTQVRSQNSWDERYSGLLRRMDDYQEEKDNPRKQVVDMEMDEFFRQRFKSLIEQYELRELHFHSQMRTKELEVQFNLARFEREKKNYESELARSRQLNSQVQTFSKTETELRQQLNVYVDKFKQDTLNNSNDLFLTFRKEMEDMSKKTKRLERENENLKRKHEQVNNNILKMAEERNKNLAEIGDLKKKLEKLNGIIKQMQQQGRGIPQGMTGQVENGYVEGEADIDGDESEYEDEYDEGEDEEVSDDGDDYDDETEDELHHHHEPQQALEYGPERPPVVATAITATIAAVVTTNGHH
ncbi:myosin-like coiled-coil protein-domain-containing protein [Lasiosphaeris hirsuta]|uniref:Myosin-like coiled-coil protein-domain-containing protein n=1 Tax=Lasiosphaeris hirsuta TaxID=260670 RepID=A0AA40AQV4_9PEZI|nr:myosin-like coiled-coil protein-domain-containing protein [Lasiosphaeris hirsuta]